MRYLASITITLDNKVVKTHTITYDNRFNTTKNLIKHIREDIQGIKSIKITYEPTDKKIYLTTRKHNFYGGEEKKSFQNLKYVD